MREKEGIKLMGRKRVREKGGEGQDHISDI